MAAKFGEVATRLSVLGCIGESGADKDLRRVREPVALRKSLEDGGRLHGVEGGGGFAASFSDLMVTLIICVAKAALSFALSSCFDCPWLVFEVADRPVPFVFDFVSFDDRAVCEAAFAEFAKSSVSHTSSSFKVTSVAAVQVEVDAMAALADSTFACNEVIYVMCVSC